MTRRSQLRLLFLFPVLTLACTKQDQPAPAPKAAPAAAAAPHEHTERQELGALTLGRWTVRVFQVAPVTPGQEGDFDLDFAPGGGLPEAVRGWVGAEDGVGSRKVRFAKETADRMHGHPEVPSPLAPEARFWLEIEGAGKGSVAPKR